MAQRHILLLLGALMLCASGLAAPTIQQRGSGSSKPQDLVKTTCSAELLPTGWGLYTVKMAMPFQDGHCFSANRIMLKSHWKWQRVACSTDKDRKTTYIKFRASRLNDKAKDINVALQTVWQDAEFECPKPTAALANTQPVNNPSPKLQGPNHGILNDGIPQMAGPSIIVTPPSPQLVPRGSSTVEDSINAQHVGSATNIKAHKAQCVVTEDPEGNGATYILKTDIPMQSQLAEAARRNLTKAGWEAIVWRAAKTRGSENVQFLFQTDIGFSEGINDALSTMWPGVDLQVRCQLTTRKDQDEAI